MALMIALFLFLAACGQGEPITGDLSADPDTALTAGAPEPDGPELGDSDDSLATDGFILVDQVPGDPREDTISALDDSSNPELPSPLVDVAAIRSGGPPPDGIPPIDAPAFERASTVDWLEDNEPVVVLSVDGESRAYPIQILTWHELVNDTYGDIPVTVSFCPLCNSAVAYRRDVDGRILDFGTSGRLFNSSLVMYDRQTESLWTHFTGSAVVGALTGTQLELLPLQTTSWASFRDANPDSLVLSRMTGHSRDYGRNPYPGYDDISQAPFLFDGEPDDRLQAKQHVVAIRAGGDAAVVVLDDLAEIGVIEVDVGGAPATVWHIPGTASSLDSGSIADGRDIGATGVFSPVVDGERLDFVRDETTFSDSRGNTWDILGTAISGPLTGERLEPIEHLDTFWFAIAAFSPDVRIAAR